MSDTESCCGDIRRTLVTRVILHTVNEKDFTQVIRAKSRLLGETIDFKAIAVMNGSSRRASEERGSGSNQKRSSGGKLGHTLLSLALPGDTDPLRSPVRSAVYRTLTPGFGVGGGISPKKRNEAYRCPEGYQYGGRFTDSRLSTCGAKLFDIPSPLGALIGAIGAAFRSRLPDPITGNILGAGEMPDTLIEARKPQIPKVSAENGRLAEIRIKEMKNSISTHPAKTARMVRKDGFVLEPVVPPKVLRAIPDNRDMEGATYLMSAFGASDIGGEEIGMLSNTGIKSIVYITPSGSTLTIEKRRPLTVGERRKLGKTVTQAMQQNNSKDPAAKLKYLALEMGDGIGYSEDFNNLKNPNEVLSGRPRWASEVFKNTRVKKPVGSSGMQSRETVSSAAVKKKIKSLDEAMAFIMGGGSLSQISPELIPKVLSQSSIINREKISANQNMVTVGSSKYFEYTSPKSFQHIAERFASDIQEHLGLVSPDVIFYGSASDKRKYLREDVETALQGSVFNPNVQFNDLKPEDVAKMMIADFLTDQRERNLSSVYGMQTAEGLVPMLAQNTTSALVDLSKVQITKRTKMNIADFYEETGKIDYSSYYMELRLEQQLLFRRTVEALLKRARSFKLNDLKSRLSVDGLSAGELSHLNIVDKLFEARVNSLSTQKKKLIEALKG